jgi:hypothetical protein
LLPAAGAAQIAVGLLLDPNRAMRIADAHARDPEYPGLDEVLAALISATWRDKPRPGMAGAVQRAVARVALDGLLGAAASRGPAALRGSAWVALKDLRARIKGQSPSDPEWQALVAIAVWDIDQVEQDPSRYKVPSRVAPPAFPSWFEE